MRNYYRHPNGGGRIFSMHVDVEPSAFIDEESMVGHGARVLGDSRIYASKVAGSAVVRDAYVSKSEIGRMLNQPFQAFFPLVLGAGVTIFRSRIYGQEISSNTHALIVDCELHEQTVVRGRVFLGHVVMTGDARVIGSGEYTKMSGSPEQPIHLHGLMYVHEGEWLTAPRYAEVGKPGDGVHVGITECVDGKVNVGCWCKPLEWWIERDIKKGWRFAQELLGWTDENIAQVREALYEWRDSAS